MSHDIFRDLALDGEDIGQLPIIMLGPNVSVRAGINQLGRDANVIAHSADAAFQKVSHAQLAPDFRKVTFRISITHDRAAADHLQVGNLGERGQNIILNAVREITVLFVVAKIIKRENGDALAFERVRGNPRRERMS